MSILDKVIKAREAPQAQHGKFLVHGLSGSGKSTLCGTMPKPILYAYTEPQGLASFARVAPDEATLHIESIKDIGELFKFLRDGKRDNEANTVEGFRSLALDSLTELQRMIIAQYEDQQGGIRKKENQREAITIAQWGNIIERTLHMVRGFRDLPCHVLLTALSAETIMGEENAKRMVRPDVAGKKLPSQLAQFFQCCGYAFKRNVEGGIQYSVLFEGSTDFLVKPLPGLRFQEDPDVEYWIDRGIFAGDARDAEGRMSAEPTAIQIHPAEKKTS